MLPGVAGKVLLETARRTPLPLAICLPLFPPISVAPVAALVELDRLEELDSDALLLPPAVPAPLPPPPFTLAFYIA